MYVISVFMLVWLYFIVVFFFEDAPFSGHFLISHHRPLQWGFTVLFYSESTEIIIVIIILIIIWLKIYPSLERQSMCFNRFGIPSVPRNGSVLLRVIQCFLCANKFSTRHPVLIFKRSAFSESILVEGSSWCIREVNFFFPLYFALLSRETW